MTHVPYRVTSQLVTDLVAGEVPAGSRRCRKEVPTAAEPGLKGYESAAWFAFLAPRGTPKPIVDKLHAEIAGAMADPAVRSRFAEFGAEPMASSPQELASLSPNRGIR